jgi:hypothetical protein
MPTEAFVRHQLFKPAAAAAGVAVALAVCGGPVAAATRTGGPLVASGTAAHAASAPGCVTILTLGPRSTAAGAYRTLGPGGWDGGRAGSLGQGGGPQLAGPHLVWRRPAPSGAAPARSASAGAKYTVTVVGTTIAGRAAGGLYDTAFLFNADDSAKFDNIVTSIKTYRHGVAKFQVPAGHYWAVGDFTKLLPKQKSWDEYLDVLPQFTVSGNTTIHLNARAATSPIEATVARPAVTGYLTFQIIRSAAAGQPVSLGWALTNNGPKSPAPTLYVSPTSKRPTVGKLATVTSEQLGSKAFTVNSRYLYYLASHSSGTIPPQQHVIDQAALATVRLRYYSDPSSIGVSGTFPWFPVNQVCSLGGAVFGGMRFPVAQTEYLQAGGPLSWQTQFIQNFNLDTSGGQIGPSQAYLPGERQTQNFGAYPLHPAPNVRLSDVPGQPPVQVSAGRAGNSLRLAMTAFSDSVPGHTGQGTFPPVKTAASYQIDQNGTKIAGGTVPHFFGPFAAAAKLSPAPSTIRFTLNAAESARLSPLSTASHTVWTWRSARAAGARLPTGWTCLPGGAASRACAVQPMMTLRYGVVGLGLDGSTAPGQQVVTLQVGHLQLARAAAITSAAVSVSFDGGSTWRPARVTGRGGSYAAVFRAPAGARVTLRAHASDAAGGSVAETITNAYQVR